MLCAEIYLQQSFGFFVHAFLQHLPPFITSLPEQNSTRFPSSERRKFLFAFSVDK